MAFIHGNEFLVGSTLLVQNLPSGLSTDHLTQIFKFGTPPVRLKVFFQNSSTPSVVKRFCLVELETQEQLRQGVSLHGKEFFGSKLMISLATHDNIPKIDQNMPIETGVGTIVNKFAPPPIEALRPPSRFPPLTPQQTDEVSRTIYVGNVNSEVTQDILQGLFETCGKITYIRLAGDDTHPSRFAFIEFLTKEAAQEAMGMNGKILVDRPLKVNHSKNPIVKTPTTTPREEEAIQRRLRRAADRIERSIRREYEKKSSRSRSRSKSRKEREKSPEKDREREKEREREREKEKEKEREREREKRHRSPSPEYYDEYYDRKYGRSGSRERSHHHSSSRSSHHHHHDPYDKYSSHSHRSSRDRYSRSSSKYYPEDDYYYRESRGGDYYHDRDRDRDREREREREREYYKEKERRDRKHSSSSHKSSSSHHHSSSSSSSRKDKSSDKRKRSPSPSSDKDAKKQKIEDKTEVSTKN